MQINGEWFLSSDGIVRPIIRGQIRAADGSWVSVSFLMDTGADRTVFSAAVLAALYLQPLTVYERLSGLGGMVRPVFVETQIRFRRETGRDTVVFRGQYAAVTEGEALDMSVLGRDVTGLFAVIIDQPGNVVCLPGQQHRYIIDQQ